MNDLPSTTAHLRIHRQSFAEKYVDGEVSAGGFEWQFSWKFGTGELNVEPSLGRALIQDALMRFLIRADYNLEPGRAKEILTDLVDVCLKISGAQSSPNASFSNFQIALFFCFRCELE